MSDQPVAELITELAERLGRERFTEVCVALMAGAPREDHLDELPWLTGHSWDVGSTVRDREKWPDYWLRVWGARGLLHVWDDTASETANDAATEAVAATAAVVAGLADEHWRPAEMCLKVSARHEVAGTGDGAARLASHEKARVRTAAVRALAVVGDTEHVHAIREALDDPDATVRAAAERAWDQLHERLDLPGES